MLFETPQFSETASQSRLCYTGPVRPQSSSGMVSGGQAEGDLKHIWLGVTAYSEQYVAEITLANLRLGQTCLHKQ